MGLTPQAAFEQLEVSNARMLGLLVRMSGDDVSDAGIEAAAELMEEITGSIVEAWASLAQDGRAIDAMRSAIAGLPTKPGEG